MKKSRCNLIQLMFSAGLLLVFLSPVLFAGESFIPLEAKKRIASDDLIYNNQKMSSKEADNLANTQKINLATLDPTTNDIWSSSALNIDDQK